MDKGTIVALFFVFVVVVVLFKTAADRESMQVIMELSVEIKDLPTLSTAITRLEQLPNVVSVRRKA